VCIILMEIPEWWGVFLLSKIRNSREEWGLLEIPSVVHARGGMDIFWNYTLYTLFSS